MSLVITYNFMQLLSFYYITKTSSPYCLCNQQRALDHEGLAVGVAALWGYSMSIDE